MCIRDRCTSGCFTGSKGRLRSNAKKCPKCVRFPLQCREKFAIISPTKRRAHRGSHGGVVAPSGSGRVKSTCMALSASGLAGYNETHVQRKLCMGLAFLFQTKSHTGRKEEPYAAILRRVQRSRTSGGRFFPTGSDPGGGPGQAGAEREEPAGPGEKGQPPNCLLYTSRCV